MDDAVNTIKAILGSVYAAGVNYEVEWSVDPRDGRIELTISLWKKNDIKENGCANNRYFNRNEVTYFTVVGDSISDLGDLVKMDYFKNMDTYQ